MMGYGAGLGFGYGGLLALLGCILLVVGIVVLVAWVVGRSTQTQAGMAQTAGPGAQDAVEVLKQRYARGEITADEFTAAKQVLEAHR